MAAESATRRGHAPPEEIGRRIRERRQAIQAAGGRLRRVDLANAAGVSERTMDNIEAGKASSQTHERLRAIADVLEVSFAELTAAVAGDESVERSTGSESTLPQNLAQGKLGG
jgi:transcriptional regulator with XRE-family HTH domain